MDLRQNPLPVLKGRLGQKFFDHVFRKDGEFVLQAVFFGVLVKLLDGDIKFAMSISM